MADSGHEIKDVRGSGASTMDHHHGNARAGDRHSGSRDGLSGVRRENRGHDAFTVGRPASIDARRGSSHGGSLREVPRSGTDSSAVNPGGIVATSNSTPPGSRK